jgi:hypothetical protein
VPIGKLCHYPGLLTRLHSLSVCEPRRVRSAGEPGGTSSAYTSAIFCYTVRTTLNSASGKFQFESLSNLAEYTIGRRASNGPTVRSHHVWNSSFYIHDRLSPFRPYQILSKISERITRTSLLVVQYSNSGASSRACSANHRVHRQR